MTIKQVPLGQDQRSNHPSFNLDDGLLAIMLNTPSLGVDYASLARGNKMLNWLVELDSGFGLPIVAVDEIAEHSCDMNIKDEAPDHVESARVNRLGMIRFLMGFRWR